MWPDCSIVGFASREFEILPYSLDLYNFANAKACSKVVEVGAGSGLAAACFLRNSPKTDKCRRDIYLSDYSPNMCRFMTERFAKDTALGTLVPSSDEGGTDSETKIHVCCANNEKLPYPDLHCEAYMSSLSLQVVNNPANQINEAFRVLKSGGKAAFYVWGRSKSDLFYSPWIEVLQLFDIKVDTTHYIRSFRLGNDPEAICKVARECGFSKVRYFYKTMHCHLEDVETYFNFFVSGNQSVHEKIMNSPELIPKIKQELEAKLADLFLSTGAPNQFMGYELMGLVCQK